MNIGVDASCWTNQRGYGRYTRELLRALLALDPHHTYWLFLDAQTAAQSHDLPTDRRVRRVVVPTSQAATQGAAAAGRRSLRDMWAMSRAVSRHARGLDLFFFPSVYTFYPVWGLSKVILTIHDAIPEHYPQYIFPHWWNRLLWETKVRGAIRQADLIATVSRQARRDIVQSFGVPEAAVWVVPDAVSPEFHPVENRAASQTVLARYGVPGGRYILYVGGISPHKNLATLIQAYASLIQTTPHQDVNLVLVGDFQHDVFFSSYPAIRQRIHDLGLADRILTAGFVPDADLVHFYTGAAVFVLPSLDEGFGLPALEAMACGAPVIASRAGALPEVVGTAGLFFHPTAPDELTACLSQVLGDDHLRQTLQARGLQRARQFTWVRSAQAALQGFETVVRGLASQSIMKQGETVHDEATTR